MCTVHFLSSVFLFSFVWSRKICFLFSPQLLSRTQIIFLFQVSWWCNLLPNHWVILTHPLCFVNIIPKLRYIGCYFMFPPFSCGLSILKVYRVLKWRWTWGPNLGHPPTQGSYLRFCHVVHWTTKFWILWNYRVPSENCKLLRKDHFTWVLVPERTSFQILKLKIMASCRCQNVAGSKIKRHGQQNRT